MKPSKIPPFPAKGQGLKYPALEKYSCIGIWLTLLFVIILCLLFASTSHGQLLNISTRGYVGTGDKVLIVGFNLKKDGKVAIRALGPSLNIAGKLLDPTVELRDSRGILKASNDDYTSTILHPNNKKEASIVTNLGPGAYTAIIRGKNNTGGIGIIEVYDITPSPTPIPRTPTPTPRPSPTPSSTPLPTATPVERRDVTISWECNDCANWVPPIRQFRVYFSSVNDSGNLLFGDVRQAVIPNLKIGERYTFTVDSVTEDGTEGGLSPDWQCNITEAGCEQ